MKPYLREKHYHNKRDCHPRKGFVNWWEDFNNFISRKKKKQETKNEIDYETFQGKD